MVELSIFGSGGIGVELIAAAETVGALGAEVEMMIISVLMGVLIKASSHTDAARQLLCNDKFTGVFEKEIGDLERRMNVDRASIPNDVIDRCLKFSHTEVCAGCAACSSKKTIRWAEAFTQIVSRVTDMGNVGETAYSVEEQSAQARDELKTQIKRRYSGDYGRDAKDLSGRKGFIYPEQVVSTLVLNEDSKIVSVCRSCETGFIRDMVRHAAQVASAARDTGEFIERGTEEVAEAARYAENVVGMNAYTAPWPSRNPRRKRRGASLQLVG